MQEPARSPMHDVHERLGAKLIDFHGFLMPVQYAGILKEHEAVRKACGIFDVSHMGEFEVRGPDALAFLARLLPNDCRELEDGDCLYSPMLRDDGTIVDDLLVYRYGTEHFMLVVNASNIAKDFDHISSHLSGRVSLVDISSRLGLLAVQGPESAKVVTSLLGCDVSGLKSYTFLQCEYGSELLTVSRTGYTGEDGFEIYLPAQHVGDLFQKFVDAAVLPCGLGARDTLRFEARLPLYGNEMTDQTNPLETGLKRFVKFGDRDFVGKNALLASEVQRKLVGIQFEDKSISRTGAAVRDSLGNPVGAITSGSFCPSLNLSCALALVASASCSIGASVEVESRGKWRPAKVIKTPFYRRKE